MNVLVWIMVLFSLSFLVLGLALLLGMIPAKWKARTKLTHHSNFMLKFLGVALIVFGLEGILNILAPRMGWALPDTNGIIGLSMMTLWFLTVGIGWLSGTIKPSTDGEDSRNLRWFGAFFVFFGIAFFMDAMGHKMSNESMESAGEYLKLVSGLFLIVPVATRKSNPFPGSSQNE